MIKANRNYLANPKWLLPSAEVGKLEAIKKYMYAYPPASMHITHIWLLNTFLTFFQ